MKQILYRIKSLFLLVAIAGGISACADDKGNYNYHDIPEVKIEGIGSSIQALAYQNLSIPVQLDGLEADEDRYEYEWLAIRQFEAEDANDSASEVLATTKEFNDIIDAASTAEMLKNPQARWDSLAEAEKILLDEDVAVFPTVQNGLAMLINPKVHGLEVRNTSLTWNYRFVTMDD